MTTQPSKEDRELSLMVKELTDGITEELKAQIPHINLKPIITDVQIQQAILDITPEGWMELYQQFGQQAVLEFVSEFSKGRQW